MHAQAGAAYDWVAIVAGLLGVIGLLGAAIAVLRSSIATKTIKLLKDNNEAQEATNKRQAGQIVKLEETVKKQAEEIAVLKGLVSGTKILEAMNGKLDRLLAAIPKGGVT